MAAVSIRSAVVTDNREIADVHRLARADYYGTPPDGDDDREAMWAHLLAQPRRTTYVAETADGVVGFMSALRRSDPVAELKLTAMYVRPAHFGRGIGSRLHDAFEAERAHDEAGTLEVWARNRRAIDFYSRRGWAPTTQTRPGPQGADFVTYTLPARAMASRSST